MRFSHPIIFLLCLHDYFANGVHLIHLSSKYDKVTRRDNIHVLSGIQGQRDGMRTDLAAICKCER